MRQEVAGLEDMGTLEVVDYTPDMHLAGSRWVMTIKVDASRVMTRFKARLAARGDGQQSGVDYEEVFSPVVPMDANRAVLATAANHDWQVNTTCLT